ncbi:MAG: alkaline phosphatase family protein [Eubacterium sp.]|nr:alkaline phosphatase family protein [Eubacterium sp.]
MKEIIKREGPDYSRCLVNLANSILKKFGAETTADTLGIADEYLAKDYKNVVVLLLDAMGTSIIEKHLEEGGFFRSHLKDTYYSVYPPTTVAATTSILSGLYPNEHGWLGWDVFFPELSKNVTVYTNTDQMTEKSGAEPTDKNGKMEWGEDSLMEFKPAADYNVSYKYIPYKNIIDKINDAGGTAYLSIPFAPPFPDTLDKVIDHVKELCDEPGKKFIYAYWNEPDSTMHRTGTVSDETHNLIIEIEEKVNEFSEKLSDTLLIITADHSHMDSRNLCLLDYPEVTDCLVRMPSIEPRTLNLFVKEEYRDTFPDIFKRNFGENFLLLTKEEVIENKLFGTGTDREGLKDMIGDYVALSIADVSIFNTHIEAEMMPGGHAGLTAEECRIPFVVVENK